MEYVQAHCRDMFLWSVLDKTRVYSKEAAQSFFPVFSSASLSFTSIWLSQIFLRTQRGMTEEKRDLWKDQGCKASSSHFLVVLTSSLFFLSSSKPLFLCFVPLLEHMLQPCFVFIQWFLQLKDLMLLKLSF